jgi:hypothetical protein
MLDAFKLAPRPTSFLQDQLITDPVKTHDTAYLEIDKVFEGESIASYSARDGGPDVVGKDGYDTLLHVAPYMYDEMTMTPKDADTRLPGNTIYEGSSGANVDVRTGENLNLMRDRFKRREEQQIAEGLRTGKIEVDGRGVKYTIDFKMPAAHKITLTAGDVWGSTTEDKLAQLEDWSELIQDAGAATPSRLYMAMNVARLLVKDTNIRALLDNRRIEQGQIDFRQLEQQRATYFGTLAGIGLNVELYAYQGSYKPDGGSRTRYIPDDYLIMTSPNVKVVKHYSKIENFKAGGFVGEVFPNMWMEESGKRKHMSLESGPLIELREPEGVVAVKVK